MKSIRRARRNLQYLQEKRQYESDLLSKAKTELINDKPELAQDLKIKERPPNYKKRTLKCPPIDESQFIIVESKKTVFDGKTYEVPDEETQEEFKQHIDTYWRSREEIKEAEWKKFKKLKDLQEQGLYKYLLIDE